MIYSTSLKSILEIIGYPSLKKEIEDRFTPLYNNTNLVSAINSTSSNSPVFKEALMRLSRVVKGSSIDEFIVEYEKFHNTVMILFDEIALTIKKEADLIKEIDIHVYTTHELSSISSRLFIGNSMLLVFTFNEDLLHETLKRFKKPNLKTKAVSRVPSA